MQIHWKKLTLGDLGQIITGKTPSTQNSLFWDGNIPFITPKDIQSSKHILTTERYLSQDGAHAVKSSILPKDSICVSCIGNIGYIGKTTKLSVSNQQINSIIPNQYNDSDFIYYLMKSLWVYFKNYEGQSTALSILNKSQFSNIEISIPPLDIQKKIAGVLGALDDKIELNNKINQNLEAQAQALFKSWFIDFEPFGGKMPIDWKIGKVDDIAKQIICGKTPSTKCPEYYGRDIPFITIPDMHGSTYVIKTERYLSTKGANIQRGKTLPPNSICVSCIGTAGLVSLNAYKSQTNQQINSIIADDAISPYYIYLVMKSIADVIKSFGSSGSTICNLNKDQFSNIDILIPSEIILSDFHKIVSTQFDAIKHNLEENLRLAELRDTLLPKLMNGEIDVDNVKID